MKKYQIITKFKFNVYDAIPSLSKENEKKEEESKKLNNEKKEKGDKEYVNKVIESNLIFYLINHNL